MPGLRAALAVGLVVAVTGCSAPSHSDTDTMFVLHMLPHHQRALEVGALAAASASDPRVKAFGERIVNEQTPEEQRLADWVDELELSPHPDDRTMADGYIDDDALARLKAESGSIFDRDFLLLSARSEEGAAAMASTEIQSGTYEPALTLARSIATAPDSEIPELRDLAAQIP